MTIEFYQLEECHKVIKPWGQEIWLQGGSSVYPFVLKELILLAGCQTSLQVHKDKSESIHVHAGTGKIVYHPQLFDCQRFLLGKVEPDELVRIKSELIVYDVGPGSVFHTPPGTIHRMIANEDLHYTEASTTELDDVIRLEDSSGRGHGRIDAEHSR